MSKTFIRGYAALKIDGEQDERFFSWNRMDTTRSKSKKVMLEHFREFVKLHLEKHVQIMHAYPPHTWIVRAKLGKQKTMICYEFKIRYNGENLEIPAEERMWERPRTLSD